MNWPRPGQHHRGPGRAGRRVGRCYDADRVTVRGKRYRPCGGPAGTVYCLIPTDQEAVECADSVRDWRALVQSRTTSISWRGAGQWRRAAASAARGRRAPTSRSPPGGLAGNTLRTITQRPRTEGELCGLGWQAGRSEGRWEMGDGRWASGRDARQLRRAGVRICELAPGAEISAGAWAGQAVETDDSKRRSGAGAAPAGACQKAVDEVMDADARLIASLASWGKGGGDNFYPVASPRVSEAEVTTASAHAGRRETGQDAG